MKKVYCIVITYNGNKWVDKCFGSIRNSSYPMTTIAVDNGSTDGTQQRIQSKFPEVNLIQSKENLGFGKANNLGIQIAINEGADYIFLLNQDAYLHKGSLHALLNSFAINQSIGIISPIHLAGDEINLEEGFYRYMRPENTPFILCDSLTGNPNQLYKTKFVNAAAWIIKSDVINRVGIFNPSFDHYGEDDEYVFRLRKQGFDIAVYTQYSIVHDRPQYGNSLRIKDTKKSSLRFKQRILVKYFTGEYNMSQVNKIYVKVLFDNLFNLKIERVFLTFKNWISVNEKIKKYNPVDSYLSS